MTKNENVQDVFLNTLRTHKIPVTVFMANGFQQKGTVASFDGYTILLVNEGKQYMIYKHAVSTIVPARCVQLHE
ncbi:MAG: RNA chaperone Hfq [Clostridia bacterium]|nr:RNA chaperone Hfq [Clostridia bacterium]MBQ6867975.1 RNA chaperone Hfq [Clostridia bacterium]